MVAESLRHQVMSSPGKQKQLIRQDWIRNQIQSLAPNLYQLQQPQGCFLTRKAIPKGMYILRLKIETNLEDFTTCISIEPVGGSNARGQQLQIPISKKQCDLSLPLVLEQRSKIRIEPIQEPSLFHTTFSILPTTQLGCLRLLRQWSEPSLDQSIGTKTGAIKEEIQKLAAQLYHRGSLRHRSWQKGATTKKQNRRGLERTCRQ